ncbi:hypothetical protein MtrunA17_Chr5g0415721 [Medicago truncatula]|uniref:Uncharacterized protein n=1 Tax=Medicago truncatula TaxID=3880 RepID=A0A396HV37_MEDTR|nr:hypothetical protein MtrunA17_Chr5g0415721 [Medicago truncatula]
MVHTKPNHYRCPTVGANCCESPSLQGPDRTTPIQRIMMCGATESGNHQTKLIEQARNNKTPPRSNLGNKCETKQLNTR